MNHKIYNISFGFILIDFGQGGDKCYALRAYIIAHGNEWFTSKNGPVSRYTMG